MDSFDLVNAALAEVGASPISAIDDTKPAGRIAGDVYESKRDALLRAHPWNFAQTFVRLGLHSVVPKHGWDHAYALPSDWVRTASVYNNPNRSGQARYKQAAIFLTEAVSNGTFDSATGWSGANWTIANGVATHTAGSTAALTQTATLTASARFRIVFTVSGMTAGTVTPTFSGGTGVSGTARSVDGFYAEEIVAHSGGNTAFNIVPTSTFNGTIDDLTVTRMSGDDQAANSIWSDDDALYLDYIRKVTDVDLMSPGFHQALIFLLAKVFAGGLSTSATMHQISDEDMKSALRIAKSVDAIEDYPEERPIGSWAEAMEGSWHDPGSFSRW